MIGHRPACGQIVHQASALLSIGQSVRALCERDPIAMIRIAFHRSLSGNIARSDVRQGEQGHASHGWLFKSGFEKPVHGDSHWWPNLEPGATT
jgi:hypothetical protein